MIRTHTAWLHPVVLMLLEAVEVARGRYAASGSDEDRYQLVRYEGLLADTLRRLGVRA